MDNLISEFSELKLSALSKAKAISPFIRTVTIGPNAAPIKQHHPNIPRDQVDNVVSEQNENIAVNNFAPIRNVLHDYEQERKEMVSQNIKHRRKRVVEFNKRQEELGKNKWNEQQQRMLMQMEQKEVQIMQALNQIDIDASKEQEKMAQIYHDMAKQRIKHMQEIEEKQQKHRRLTKIMDEIYSAQQEFNKEYAAILNIITNCNDELKTDISVYTKNLGLLGAQMQEIVKRSKEQNVVNDDVVKCLEIINFAKTLKQDINSSIDGYNNKQQQILVDKEKAKNEEKRRIELAKLEKLKQDEAKKAATVAAVSVSVPNKSAYKTYCELQLFLQHHEENCKNLREDIALERFRFKCKKAVNLPLNAISGKTQNIDKYNTLHNLLSGKPVQFVDEVFDPTKHPQGIPFSTNLLAQKFIQQGYLLITGNPEAAFIYSTIMISLWNDFPQFGKLLTAHFYRECPYLVPIYLPKLETQSEVDYYKSLGYEVHKDGTLEQESRFLERMSGIFRLYFSMMITKPKREQKTHPYTIKHAWVWLVNILNMEPRRNITATALQVFLEVLGPAMERTYGKQFKKIVHLIGQHYLGILKSCGEAAPVGRLENLLQSYQQEGQFQEPKGQLPNNFW